MFHTTGFFTFLAAVLAMFYLSPRSWRRVILLAASYFFYMSWNAKFVVLLLVLTATDYIAALWMARVPAGGRRKTWLIVGLCANLGFLGFFKYFNFLAGNVAMLLGRPADAYTLSIILPMGISFHTFQSISYLIDVYRGTQPAIRNPIDYALYIAFFPQLVAGPIVRARDFFANLYAWKAPQPKEQLRGMVLVVFGLAKKLVVADQFAQLADGYFRDPVRHPGSLAAWGGAIAFSLQIFFDFSGYTDMAIGAAQLFGFHFPGNFRRPYLAETITEFWRRWHISLSTWLRDYLYIPLGGNRHGRAATYRNLMLTMALGGLWHGASWNFVVWGGYHGALLSGERALGIGRRKGWQVARVALTFALVTIGWVFFRAASFTQSEYVIGQMFAAPGARVPWPRWQLWAAVILLILAVLEERRNWFERLVESPAWLSAAALGLLLFCIEILAYSGPAVPFVYFQF
jgi:alginate O-acetyltransferase complex protein AlgI